MTKYMVYWLKGDADLSVLFSNKHNHSIQKEEYYQTTRKSIIPIKSWSPKIMVKAQVLSCSGRGTYVDNYRLNFKVLMHSFIFCACVHQTYIKNK